MKTQLTTPQHILPIVQDIYANIHHSRQTSNGKIVCTHASEPSISHPSADTNLHLFCDEHWGIDIAHGANFSTYYDADNSHGNGDDGKRLYFTVTNACAPNGIYLPRDTCLRGFGRLVARCSPRDDYESGRTSGGLGSEECLVFALSVQLAPAGGLKEEE